MKNLNIKNILKICKTHSLKKFLILPQVPQLVKLSSTSTSSILAFHYRQGKITTNF